MIRAQVVKGLTRALISVSAMASCGWISTFDESEAYARNKKTGETISFEKRGGIYEISAEVLPFSAVPPNGP